MFFILSFFQDDIIENTNSNGSTSNNSTNDNMTSGNMNKKSSNYSLMELLEKYFNENPWYDLTNLDELIKLTGLDEASIKVFSIFKTS